MQSKPKKKILIITHYFPPSTVTQRPYYLARHLSDMGYSVCVLTTKKLVIHGAIKNWDIYKNFHLVEVEHEPFSSLVKILGKILNPGKQHKETNESYSLLFSLKKFRDFFLRIFGPNFDITLSWVPFAFSRAIKMKNSGEFDFDVVITTFPPPSVHILGWFIKSKYPNVKWIADYRDLWSSDIIFGSKIFYKVSVLLERAILKNADHITTVSNILSRKLYDILGKNITVIRNSFSPEPIKKRTETETKNKRKITFVYTGAFYKKFRDPENFFKAISVLRKTKKDLHEKMSVEIYGIPNIDIEDMIKRYGIGDIVFYRGVVSHEESIRIQSSADYLLFFNITEVARNPELDKGVITGKLFEYIFSGKPIISIGKFEDSEANEIIRETGTGIFIENTPEKIAEFLQELIYHGRKVPFSPKWDKIYRYSAEGMAKSFAEIIEKNPLLIR